MNKFKILRNASLIFFIIIFSGCEKERVGLQDAPDMAKVAVMNVVTPNRPSSVSASSGLLGYLLYIDNNLLYSTALIPNKTTGYFLVDPGSRVLKADSTQIGTNVTFPSATVSTVNLQAEAGKFYSVFFTGKVQSPETVITTDDLTRPAAGKTHVRVINLSPDAGAIDVAGKFTTASGTAPVLFSNIAYKNATAFTALDGGFYRLEVRAAGSPVALGTYTQDNQIVPLFIPGSSSRTDFSMNLEAGKVYTLVIRGYLDPSIATVGQIANPLSVGALINVYF